MVSAMLSRMAAGMGLLVSPDHLRMWSNLAGNLEVVFWPAVFGAIIVFALSASSYRRLMVASASDGGHLYSLRLRFGFAGVALALASRLSLAAGLSTGILVTAGFVFNETFVYWFPNFTFAFICLGIAALVHLGGYGLAQKAQTAFVVLAILGLLILIVAGIWRTGPPPLSESPPAADYRLTAVFGSLLLFAGFDIGTTRTNSAGDRNTGPAAMTAVLLSSALLLGLWCMVSLKHVPPGRLADSFIPYSLAARQIGGQLGRYLIGIVLIAGTLSVVTALFSATARMMAELARLGMLPRFCRGSDRRNLTAVLMLSVVVAVMMAAGVAGGSALEVYIRAGFVLWLLHLAAIHLAALAAEDVKHTRLPRKLPYYRFMTILPAVLVMGTGAICLWAADAERWLLSIHILATWLGVMAALYLTHKVTARRSPPTN